MLTLYHNDMSLCAQKVRVCLAEKNLPWEDRHLVLRSAEIAIESFGEPHLSRVVVHGWAVSLGSSAAGSWIRPRRMVALPNVRCSWQGSLDRSLRSLYYKPCS